MSKKKKFKPFPKIDVRIPKEDDRILKTVSDTPTELKFRRASYKMGFAKGQLVEAFALKKPSKYWK